ncbi:hypothetical protein WJX72_010667 [[Myrmecia] bisecta]|uniref:Partial AB-hydrolase lipase domain-containing protein n=1 Tax=[Myrmecia] bisecta TaxID=41462 RepID=A0AAW1PKV1_9CHLO
MHRTGSELFDKPSGWAVSEGAQKRGLVEDVRLACELAVTAGFDSIRWLIRKLLLMPQHRTSTGAQPLRPSTPSKEASYVDVSSRWDEAGARSFRYNTLRRSSSFSSWEGLQQVWTAASVIEQAGYPLEEHTIITKDGYVLKMERIPRHAARDVVFFMHGILDTSMGWVSNGVTGSQAFAAYDRGFDVWLGNSRSNPPRKHTDPQKQGGRYWHYTVNELGMYDIAAQVDHIHVVKTYELNGGTGAGVDFPLDSFLRRHPRDAASSVTTGGPAAKSVYRMRRTQSDTALDALRHHAKLDPSTAAGYEAPGEEQLRAQHTASHATNGKRPPLQDAWTAGPRPARVSANGQDGGMEPLLRGWSPPQRHRSSALQSHAIQLTDDDARSFGSPRDIGSPLSDSTSSYTTESSSGEPDPDTPRLFQGTKASVESADADGRAAGKARKRVRISLAQVAHITPDRCAAGGVEHSTQSESIAARGLHRRLCRPDDPSPPYSSARRSAELPRPGQQEQHAQHASQQRSAHSSTLGCGSGPAQPRPHRAPRTASSASHKEPYRLRAVGHSLGGASLLIYAVMCRMQRRPHHLHRLILLTPAGFHRHAPKAVVPFMAVMPALMWLLTRLRPGIGSAAYIPSSLLRYLTFKITVDLQQIPALNELMRAGLRVLMNGDSSQWDRALQMPHYNSRSMPAISFHCGTHIVQWCRTGLFQLYDYGSAAANMAHYDQATPPNIADGYKYLDMPIDIMAGRSDGVIAPENVIMHYNSMRKAGCHVTLKEFDFGHLDFTFAVKDDLRHYVLSRLLLR